MIIIKVIKFCAQSFNIELLQNRWHAEFENTHAIFGHPIIIMLPNWDWNSKCLLCL